MAAYKITLTLYVSMSDETKKFYDENEPDLHEALVTSDKAKLKVEPHNGEIQADWN